MHRRLSRRSFYHRTHTAAGSMLQPLDAKRLEQILLVNGFSRAGPHLVNVVLLEGDLGEVHPLAAA